jgi:hypothetical protein
MVTLCKNPFLIVFQYVENVSNWKQACENMSIPSEIMILETAIHQHQNLYESMCQAYTEVSRLRHVNVWIFECIKTLTVSPYISRSKYSATIIPVFVEICKNVIDIVFFKYVLFF